MIVPHGDGSSSVGVAGFIVSRCVVDFAFSLELMRPPESTPDQRYVTVAIESPFVLVIAGQRYNCQPQRDVESLGPALRLFQHVVEAATIESSGDLRVTFDSGIEVHVPFDNEFEAWSIGERGGVLIIATAGGGVAVFPPAQL